MSPNLEQDNTQEGNREPRYMVGNANAKYLHGKSTKPIMSLTFDGAVTACHYLSQLDYGKFTIFELVPVTVDPDGVITRQT